MSRRIVVHDEARFDAVDIAYYIAENSIDAADRFADALGLAYDQLAESPGIGTIREYDNPRLKGMRFWPVKGFSNYLIFYRAANEELEIIRVIHGARDLKSIFGSEEHT